MADSERIICASAELLDGGAAVRFNVERHGVVEPAFVVRYRGAVHAYLNRCAHVPIELDWQEGQFFDHSSLYLICSTHGALYSPESGQCLAGRCNGKGLTPLVVAERDGSIYLKE